MYHNINGSARNQGLEEMEAGVDISETLFAPVFQWMMCTSIVGLVHPYYDDIVRFRKHAN